MEFGTQEMVDDFGRLGCLSVSFLYFRKCKVRGNVSYCESHSIKSVKSLGTVQSARGMVFQGVDLVSFEGLSNLTTVTEELRITKNPRLESLAGLSSLSLVADLLITENPKLTTLEGLDGLTHVDAELLLDNNPELTSLEGLQNLQDIVGLFRLKDLPKVTSLQGLPRLSFVSLFEVTYTPLRTLGGLGSLSDSFQSLDLNFDCPSWPKCITPHEHEVFLAAQIGSQLRLKHDSSWSRWHDNSCGIGHAFCVALMPCVVDMGGANLTDTQDVRLSGADKFCGPCRSDQGPVPTARVRDDGTVSLEALLSQQQPGDYSICSCAPGHNGVGPVGQVTLLGPGRVAGELNFVRGLDTGIEVTGNHLEEGDEVFLAVRCPQGPWDAALGGSVATRDASGLYHFASPLAMSKADPGTYKLCWRASREVMRRSATLELEAREQLLSQDSKQEPSPGGGRGPASAPGGAPAPKRVPSNWSLPALSEFENQPGNRRLVAGPAGSSASGCTALTCTSLEIGSLSLLGPFLSDQESVVMGTRLSVPNLGIGVSKYDRMRLLPTCGAPPPANMTVVMEANSSAEMIFDFGALAPGSVRAVAYRKCWCSGGRRSGRSSSDGNGEDGANGDEQTSSTAVPAVTGGPHCVEDSHYAADAGYVSIVCPQGQEATAEGQCHDCSPGRFKDAAGNQPCTACPPGTFAGGNGSITCSSCVGAVAPDPGHRACQRCSEWEVPAESLQNCTVDANYVFAYAAFVACCLWASLSLLLLLRQPLRVQDISLEQGKTVVTTLSPHGLQMYGRRPFPLSAADTGHPLLDSSQGCWLARVLSPGELELLTREGSAVTERLDTSRGVLRLPLVRELWHKGWPVPIALSVPVLVGVAVGIAVQRLGPPMAGLGAAGAVLLASVVSMAWRSRRRASLLEKRLKKFGMEIQKENPQPVACPKGPGRAIKLGKLHDVLDFFGFFIRDRTAYYMDSNIFRPLTARRRLSYAELVGPSEVQWFVSHFWGTPFAHFCEALRSHAETVTSASVRKSRLHEAIKGSASWREVSYWICFCSNNQYQLSDELGCCWSESSFYVTLQSGKCLGTCMVLDNLALPLTRSWCIFEVLQSLLLERGSGTDFAGLFLCTASGVLNWGQGSVEVALGVVNRVATLDMEEAGASVEADKIMINTEVIKQMGSFDVMNSLVRNKLRAILTKAQRQVNRQFDDLFSLIDGGQSVTLPETSGMIIEEMREDSFGEKSTCASDPQPGDYVHTEI